MHLKNFTSSTKMFPTDTLNISFLTVPFWNIYLVFFTKQRKCCMQVLGVWFVLQVVYLLFRWYTACKAISWLYTCNSMEIISYLDEKSLHQDNLPLLGCLWYMMWCLYFKTWKGPLHAMYITKGPSLLLAWGSSIVPTVLLSYSVYCMLFLPWIYFFSFFLVFGSTNFDILTSFPSCSL